MPQKKKPNNQTTLSQSLFRRKPTKRESNNSDKNTSDVLNEVHSKSQPDAGDFDDSFDLFIPRKKIPAKCSSSQPSNVTIDKCKYFSDSGELKIPKVVKDDDVELALAISLQESKGVVVSLKQPKTGHGLLSKGQQKRNAQSILMQRSPATKGKIITEKVAAVLADGKKPLQLCYSPGKVDDHFVYSSVLKKHIDQSKTLWTLSQADPGTRSSHIIKALWKYGTLDSTPNETTRGQDDVADVQRVSSSEDLFADSSDCSIPAPSPKRICHESEASELETAAKSSTENIGCATLVEDSDEEMIEKYKRIGQSVEGVKDLVEPVSPRAEQNECTPSVPSAYDPSKMVRHYEKLSSDLSTLASSSSSEVWEVKIGARKLFAHGCILRSRCPPLADALEKRPDCLNHHSFNACNALLQYIHAADISRANELDGSDKEELLQCALNYNLHLLVEELLNDVPTAAVFNGDGTIRETSRIVGADKISPTVPKISSRLYEAELNPIGSSRPILISDCSETDEPTGRTLPLKPHILSDDDELDFYLKDGIRLSEKRSSDVQAEKVSMGSAQSDNLCASSTPTSGSQKIKVPPDRFFDDTSLLPNDIASSPDQKSLSNPDIFDEVLELESNLGPPVASQQERKKSTDRFLEDSFPLPDGLSAILDTQRPQDHEDGSAPSTSAPDRPPIVNCLTPGRQLIVSEQATPLRNYNNMVTPELKKELERFGIKQGIGRKKAVTLLQYIYDQIHPPVDHPAVTKAISDVTKSNKPSSEMSYGSDDNVNSSSSVNSEDEQMFEEMGDMVSSQYQANTADRYHQDIGLLRKIGDFIKSNEQLYVAVLKYEPVSLDKFHKAIKNVGIKCSKHELMDALDELGITFRTDKTEKRLQNRRTRRPRKQKQ